ncbi:hypothetical protein SRHO_G00002080 [Serrasalmus rhombeus]
MDQIQQQPVISSQRTSGGVKPRGFQLKWKVGPCVAARQQALLYGDTAHRKEPDLLGSREDRDSCQLLWAFDFQSTSGFMWRCPLPLWRTCECSPE